MNIKNSTYKYELGISLTSLLISIAISTVVIIGLITIFKNTKTSYITVTSIGKINSNGRFAIYQLGELIKLAGFKLHQHPSAAPYIDSTTYIDGSSPEPYPFGNISFVPNWQYVGCYLLPSSLTTSRGSRTINNCKVEAERINSNYFAMGNTTTGTAHCLTKSDTDTNYLSLNKFIPINNNLCNQACNVTDIGYNCGGEFVSHPVGAVYEKIESPIQSIISSSENNSGEFEVVFRGNGQLRNCNNLVIPVNSLSTNRFSIRTIDIGNGINERSLVCSTDSGTTWNLIATNVEKMLVEYGQNILKNGSAIYYSSGANVINMLDILTVRISLLMRSDDKASAIQQANTYNMLGTNYTTPSTTRIYRLFEKTFYLSNVKQYHRECRVNIPTDRQFNIVPLAASLFSGNCPTQGACSFVNNISNCIIPIYRN